MRRPQSWLEHCRVAELAESYIHRNNNDGFRLEAAKIAEKSLRQVTDTLWKHDGKKAEIIHKHERFRKEKKPGKKVSSILYRTERGEKGKRKFGNQMAQVKAFTAQE